MLFMIKNKKRSTFFLSLLIGFSFIGCAKEEIDLSKDDIQERYDKGMELLERRKYYRAQEHFQYVLLRSRHTDIGDDSQFHLAESYFLNKEYESAISEYDKLVRQMSFSPHVRLARYRICQSYEMSSPKFYFDQEATNRAIQKYQEFIEDFPDSENREEATATIGDLRNKLSNKLLESAVLYVKMEEYDAAINYLQDLLELYFDTGYADSARLMMVETLIAAKKISEAETFLENHSSRFSNDSIREDAQSSLEKHFSQQDKKL
tara:strand:+ start:94 stop:882 length:789 start_codon:yes stop_codon:yes gene_type:complete